MARIFKVALLGGIFETCGPHHSIGRFWHHQQTNVEIYNLYKFVLPTISSSTAQWWSVNTAKSHVTCSHLLVWSTAKRAFQQLGIFSKQYGFRFSFEVKPLLFFSISLLGSRHGTRFLLLPQPVGGEGHLLCTRIRVWPTTRHLPFPVNWFIFYSIRPIFDRILPVN